MKGELLGQLTIYVLLGKEDARKPVRYFITKNRDVAAHVSNPPKWKFNGFMMLKSIEKHEDCWDIL